MNPEKLICPICGAENECQAESIEPCWCNTEKVPQELIDTANQKQQNPVCICKKCIEQFKQKGQH